MHSSWGVHPPPPPPQKNHKNIGFLRNSGPDLLKNHEATEPVFNVGPSSARQRNAIEMAFRWRADDSPLKVVFRSSHPSSTKKKTTNKKSCQSWTPSDKIFWIRACIHYLARVEVAAWLSVFLLQLEQSSVRRS